MYLVSSTNIGHHIVPLFIIFHARYAPNEYVVPFVTISALSICCLPPGRFRRIPVSDRIRSMTASLWQTGLYGQEHFMDAIFEWVYIIAGINLLYVLFARAVSFILGLFIQKFRFFLASVFATWIIEILLIFLLRNSTIFNSFFTYILFPSICMIILYFLGKLSNVSFSRGEYIYIFTLYILSQAVLLFDFVLIFFGK